MTHTPQDASRRERDSLLERATTLHKAGRFAEAERLYRQLLDVDPDDFDAVHWLGILKLHAGALQEAQGCWRKPSRWPPPPLRRYQPGHGLAQKRAIRCGAGLVREGRCAASRRCGLSFQSGQCIAAAGAKHRSAWRARSACKAAAARCGDPGQAGHGAEKTRALRRSSGQLRRGAGFHAERCRPPPEPQQRAEGHAAL